MEGVRNNTCTYIPTTSGAMDMPANLTKIFFNMSIFWGGSAQLWVKMHCTKYGMGSQHSIGKANGGRGCSVTTLAMLTQHLDDAQMKKMTKHNRK